MKEFPFVFNGIKYRFMVCGPEHFTNYNDTFGCFTTDPAMVKISETAARDQQSLTALHELIEVVNSVNELKMEHATISCLSEQLYGMLATNKKLLKFVFPTA